MLGETKATERVTFSRGYDVRIMAIDGTWRRSCVLNAISDNDAELTVEGSIQGINLKEFFLLLSSTGLPEGQAVQEAARRTSQAKRTDERVIRLLLCIAASLAQVAQAFSAAPALKQRGETSSSTMTSAGIASPTDEFSRSMADSISFRLAAHDRSGTPGPRRSDGTRRLHSRAESQCRLSRACIASRCT